MSRCGIALHFGQRAEVGLHGDAIAELGSGQLDGAVDDFVDVGGLRFGIGHAGGDLRHEIGIHGWIHELNSILPQEAERDLMRRSADTLEQITGVRPVGLRTPSWDFSQHTLEIEKEMGLLYDSSLMSDEDCYELLLDGEPTGVVEFPVEWVRDDAVYFMMNRFQSLRPYTPPSDVFDIFRREFDAAYDEGGVFQLTMHPHIIGYRSRIWILDEIIRHAKSRKGVWFATHAEVVDWAKQHAA